MAPALPSPPPVHDEHSAGESSSGGGVRTKKYVPDPDVEPPQGVSALPPLRFDYERAEMEGRVALPGLPTRLDFVTAEGRGLHEKVNSTLAQGAPVFFLPVDVQDSVNYQTRAQGGVFEMVLYGVLLDGTKARVTLTDVPVYFDVWLPEPVPGTAPVPSDAEDAERAAVVAAVLAEHGCVRHEQGKAFPMDQFREEPRGFVRVFFANLKSRGDGLRAIRKMGYSTASDDAKSSYPKMIARTYGFSLTKWMTISKYGYEAGCAAPPELQSRAPPRRQAPLVAHAIAASVADVASLVPPLRPDPKVEMVVSKNPALSKDRTLVVTFDIETHSPDKGLGTPPTAEKESDVVFMLCATAHWRCDPRPLAQVCLTTQETAPDPRWTTVICGNPGGRGEGLDRSQGQKSLLMAWALVLQAWAPEHLVGFNDGQYDTPFLVEKARKFGLVAKMDALTNAAPRTTSTDETILRWQYQDQRPMKISADKTLWLSYMKTPGMVPLDVRVAFIKRYPRAPETSLKYFLKKARLGGKAGMPYEAMWKIYEKAAGLPVSPQGYALPPGLTAAEGMRHVAHYCVVDALRCQELLSSCNYIGERREVANYSFTTFSDAFYRADGHKVVNLAFAYGLLMAEDKGFPVLGSVQVAEVEMKGKYPGAEVVEPQKGLEEDDPVAGLDFASLYPSIIETYNLSPEEAVRDQAEAARLRARGHTIYEDEFTYAGRQVPVIYHRHDNDDRKRGLFPRVLSALKKMRKAKKKVLKSLESLIEYAKKVRGDFQARRAANEDFATYLARLIEENVQEAAGLKTKGETMKAEAESAEAAGGVSPKAVVKMKKKAARFTQKSDTLRARTDELREFFASATAGKVYEAFISRLEDLEFEFAAVDSQQKAIKVFMNTFYGEAGNSLSPLFRLSLAGGVTSAGRRNLNLVIRVVQGEGHRIKYGDTDSVYVYLAEGTYAVAEQAYRGKLASLWAAAAAGGGVGLPPRPPDPGENADTLWLQKAFDLCREAPAGTAAAGFEAAVRAAYEELCTAKVELAMELMDDLRDTVNNALEADNGARILNMAYEEVLFPSGYTGKKKYFGIAHVHEPNFNLAGPDDIFVRGLDFIKQGQTKLAKVVGERCIWDATQLCPPGTRRTLVERVETAVTDICARLGNFRANAEFQAGGTTWSIQDFVQSDAWKPDKDNKSVQSFMGRMRQRHRAQLALNRSREAKGLEAVELDYLEPEPGSRFDYVLVDPGPLFTLDGRRLSPKKGDLMEYLHVASKKNLQINVEYYLIHYVVGLCARFINYEERFQPPGAAGLAYKEVDQKSQAAAVKYLTNLVKSFSRGPNAETLAAQGRRYREAYSRAANTAHLAVNEAVGHDLLFFGPVALKKADAELSAAERAAKGLTGFGTFSELPDEAEECYAEDALAGVIPRRLYAAARFRAAELVKGSAAEVKAAALHLGATGGSPEGRALVYRNLVPYRERRRGRCSGEPPFIRLRRLLAEEDQRSLAALEELAPALAAIGVRLQEAVATATEAGRAATDQSIPPEERAAAAEDAAAAAADSAPTPAEVETLKAAEGHWVSLVGTSLLLGLHEELREHLLRLTQR